MARSAASLVASLEAELQRAHGLRLADFEILDLLHQAPDGLAVAELAPAIRTQLSRSGVRLRLRLLEASGLVVQTGRVRAPVGRIVAMTDTGEKAHAACLVTVAEVVGAQLRRP